MLLRFYAFVAQVIEVVGLLACVGFVDGRITSEELFFFVIGEELVQLLLFENFFRTHSRHSCVSY